MEYKHHVEASIETINAGAGIELINHEIKKVIANCFDRSTVANKKRKAVLEIEFLPNDERTSVVTHIQAKAVLAPDKGVVDGITINDVGMGFVAKNEQLQIDNLSPINCVNDD